MIYDNSIEILVNHDSRVLKEIETLIKAGHDVNVIAIYDYTTKSYTLKVADKSVKIYGLNHDLKPHFSSTSMIRRVIFRSLTSEIISNIITALVELSNKIKIKHFFLLKKISKLKQVIIIKTDVYHAHDFNSLWICAISAWFNQKPFIYDSHELHSGTHGHEFNQRIITQEKFIIPRAYSVITINDSIADILANNNDIELPVVLRNFPKSFTIKKETISQSKRTSPLREEFRIPPDMKIMIYLGGFLPTRGLFQIVETAKQIPDVAFVLMGDGLLKEDLVKKIEMHGLSNVHLKSMVHADEVLFWASMADVGIHPLANTSLNNYYSLGNKIGEFIQAGLPFVVSDFPEMRKLAIDEDLGVVFNPEEPKDIVRAIKELLKPETYARKKQNVMDARQKYCWENEEKKLIDIYRNIESNQSRVH